MKPYRRIGLPETPRRVESIARLGYTYRDMRGPASSAARAAAPAVRVSRRHARICRLTGLSVRAVVVPGSELR